MAGNSVPGFFGRKARSKRPPGIDVTSITDLSGSMQPYASFISSRNTILALENALLDQGVGVLSSNRYSFASGGDSGRTTLASIERNVLVNGVSQRWATGSDVVNGTATLPTLTANAGGGTEDMGIASNLMTDNDRGYLGANERIIIAGSDEQQAGTIFVPVPTATAFTVSPPYPHRYVGVHQVNISITEPAGPNPIPAGSLIGFVYTTNTTGAAIYVIGSTINYRTSVPVANVTATATGGTQQLNVDHAKDTNGAIYNINTDFAILGRSLGNVLGQYLFEIS